MHFNKTIIKDIYALSWPAILEQMLIGFATLLDAAMVGHIGAYATAAVAVNITTIWLINGSITGFSMGFSFLTARFIGQKDYPGVESTIRNALVFSLLFGMGLTVLMTLLSTPLPVWLGASEEVIPYAQRYMFIIAWGLTPLTMSTIISGIFRSAGNTKLPFILSVISNTLNLLGNFFLIFPTRDVSLFGVNITLWGADLGVAGAAISTIVFQALLAFMLVYKLLTAFTPLKIGWHGNYRFNSNIIITMLKVGFPVLLERNILSFGQVVLTSMIASLGTISLAAHYLTVEIESLLYLPAYGFAFAGLTLIGQSLGANQKAQAKTYAKYLSIIGCVAIVLECLPIFIFSEEIMRLFTNDAEIIRLGSILVKIAAATEVLFSYSIIASGIFRGSGDVKYPLNVSLIGMWFIRIFLVYIFVNVLGLGLISVWIAISADMIFRFIAVLLRLRSGKWLTIWQSN